jgi:hypothetical protein
MNFIEAKKLKHKHGESFTKENLLYKVTIVPENEIDFKEFVTDFRHSDFNDESVLKYSKNSKFKVVGLWRDGVNVIKENLI